MELDLWGEVGSTFVILSGIEVCAVHGILPPSGSMITVRMDALDLGNSDLLFYRFWERFRFPEYFGWNWNALFDCLRDLSWYRADRYLLIIENAELILAEEPMEKEVFYRTLAHVAREWANPLGKEEGRGIPFKVVLLCDPNSVSSVRREVGL